MTSITTRSGKRIYLGRVSSWMQNTRRLYVMADTEEDFIYFVERWAETWIPEFNKKSNKNYFMHIKRAHRYGRIWKQRLKENVAFIFLEGRYDTPEMRHYAVYMKAVLKNNKYKHHYLNPYGDDSEYEEVLRKLHLEVIRNDEFKKRNVARGTVEDAEKHRRKALKAAHYHYWRNYWLWRLSRHAIFETPQIYERPKTWVDRVFNKELNEYTKGNESP